MVDTMIERIARAICIADTRDPDAIYPPGLGQPQWTHHLCAARVILIAMREPTEAMCATAEIDVMVDESGDDLYILLESNEAERAWTSMIDAALAEGEQ